MNELPDRLEALLHQSGLHHHTVQHRMRMQGLAGTPEEEAANERLTTLRYLKTYLHQLTSRS